MTDKKAFAEQMLASCSNDPFRPSAYYDSDGDCVEFLISNEAFKGERIDKWVTVYYSEKTGKLIGSLIKGVSKLLQQFPGLRIDVECGRVKIFHILRAYAWSSGDPIARKTYKRAIEVAEKYPTLDTEFQLA